MKKRWLTIGGLTAALTPMAAVISCGGNTGGDSGGPKLPPAPTAKELQAKQDAKDKIDLKEAKSYLEGITNLNQVNKKPSMVTETNQALLALFYPLKQDLLTSKFQGVKTTAMVSNQDDVNGSLLLKVTLAKGTQQVMFEKTITNLLTTTTFTDYEDEKWFEDRKVILESGNIIYPLSAVDTSFTNMTPSEWRELPAYVDDEGEAAWNNNFIPENANDNIIIDKVKLLGILDGYAGVKNLPVELDDPKNQILATKYYLFELGGKTNYDLGTIKKGTYWKGIGIKLKLKRGNIIKDDVILFIIGFK